MHRYVCKNVDRLIPINTYLKHELEKKYGINKEKLFRLPFTASCYENNKVIHESKSELRTTLGLSKKKIALYTGKVAPNFREVEYIIEAAKELHEIEFVLIGRKNEYSSFFDRFILDNKVNNVRFLEFMPFTKMFEYVIAADVLLSYYDRNDRLAFNQRVPAKAAVYICSMNPAIFADLPSLREWFTDDMVFFAKPNNPNNLAHTIRYVLNNPSIANEKATKAFEFAKTNNYFNAYKQVCNFILD
jgi:glycosyltransferase involved in cell wall biosynthesis